MPETIFELKTMDCIQGMQQLPAESVDLVVTSPPYNLGIDYGKYHDDLGTDEYLRWCAQWAAEVKRVLKSDGSFFLNVGAAPSNPLMPHQLIIQLAASAFVLQNTFHWIKSVSVETRDGEIISAGHFKPLNSERFVNDCHEYVFHLTKLGETRLHRRAVGVPYMDKSNIARWGHTGGEDLRCRGNNWFIPYKTILSRSKDRPHPATFPIQLAEYCIKLHGCRPDLVMLDPFLGIGHSALAAKQCQVGRFIGFDIDAEYLTVARQALQESIPSEPTIPPRPATPKRPGRKGSKEEMLLDLPE